MITFYGALWCPDCVRARNILLQYNIPHTYVSLEEHPEAADVVMKLNKGYQSIPTIVFEDGSILVEPTNTGLLEKLRQHNLIS